MEPLTDETIAERMAAPRSRRRIDLSDSAVPGLQLRLGARTASWSLLITSPSGGRERVNLGRWPNLKVAGARAAAEAVKTRTRIEDATPGGAPLGQILQRYGAERLSQLKAGPRTFRSLELLTAALRDRPATSIRRADLEAAVRRMAKHAPVHAKQALGYWKTFSRWAMTEQFIDFDPAAGLSAPRHKPPSSRALSLGELVEIWDAAEFVGYPFGQVVRLAILTGVDATAISRVKVAELQNRADGAWWSLGSKWPSRCEPVFSPLGRLAWRVADQALHQRPMQHDLLFINRAGGPLTRWADAKRRLDKFMVSNRGQVPFEPWRLADLRRSLETIARQELAMPAAVAAACVAPWSPAASQVPAEIQRDALESWAALVEHAVLTSSLIGGGSVFP